MEFLQKVAHLLPICRLTLKVEAMLSQDLQISGREPKRLLMTVAISVYSDNLLLAKALGIIIIIIIIEAVGYVCCRGTSTWCIRTQRIFPGPAYKEIRSIAFITQRNLLRCYTTLRLQQQGMNQTWDSKQTPIPRPYERAMGVCCEDIEENLSCYNGTALYKNE